MTIDASLGQLPAQDSATKRARSHSTSSSLSRGSVSSVVPESRSKPVASKRKPSHRAEKGSTAPILEPLTSHRLKIRQKQVDYGKNTLGYDTFRKQVPKERRALSDPATPDIHQKCSRRSWDGQIKKWRKLLHQYDLSHGLLCSSDTPVKVKPLAASVEQVAIERDLMQSILGPGFDQEEREADSENDFERELALLTPPLPVKPPGRVDAVVSTLHPVAVTVGANVGVDDDFLETFFDKS